MLVVVVERFEDRQALGRDLQALGPERLGELGRRLHGRHPTSTICNDCYLACRRNRSALRSSRRSGSPTMSPDDQARSTAPTPCGGWPTPHFDVLVIGGGITGAGCALDAASRGLRTALVERDDFASGTSSKSSKLVHGGLRYLQQGDVRLVYEALHERQRLRRNAPHLVKVLPFLLPVFTGKDGRGAAQAGPRPRHDHVGLRPHRRRSASASCTSASASTRRSPTCRRCAASGWPRRTSTTTRRPTTPASRSTIARTAAIDLGAAVANRVAVVEHPQGRRGRASGATRRGATAHGRRVRRARRAVVNAGGVWADDVRALDEGAASRLDPPGQGHPHHGAVVEGANDIAAVIPVPEGQALGVRRAVGRLHLHRHHRHRLRRPDRRSAVHAARTSTTCCGRSTARVTSNITDRRRHRHVGRAAPARRRRAAARAPPTCRAATGCAAPTAASSRSPAASSPPTARWRPTRSTTCSRTCSADGRGRLEPVLERVQRHSRTKRLRLRGADGYDDVLAAAARSRSPTGDGRAPGQPLRRRGPHAARHDRARPDAGRAVGRRAPLPQGRGGLRGALRDGPHRSTTCCPAAPAPGCSRRDASAEAAPTTSPR